MSEGSLRYFLTRPTKKRRSFVLVCYQMNGRQKHYLKLSDKLKDSSDQINKQFLEKTISLEQANLLFKELILSEYRRTDTPARVLRYAQLSEINQKIFEKFWSEVYGVKYLEDESSARYDILKSLRLIEPLSIQTAGAAELQAALKKSCKSTREIRRASDRINELLRYCGRGFSLRKPKEGRVTPNHLTHSEFEAVLGYIENPILKDLAQFLFGSGCRLGEALAVTPEDYRDGELMIDKQLREDGTLKLPKREKSGRILVLPGARSATLRWLEVPDKGKYRWPIYAALIEACKKAFPDKREKWCSPHDLRHSHAIHLLSLGATLTQVALNLRNRIDVCQRYYTGFSHSEGSLEYLKKLVR